MKLSTVILTFILSSVFISVTGQRLYVDAQNDPKLKREVNIIPEKGFIETIVVNNNESITSLFTNFYDETGEKIINNHYKLIKSQYLGYFGYENTHRFLFYDIRNKRTYIPTYDNRGNLLEVGLGKVKSYIAEGSIFWNDSSGFYTHRKNGQNLTFTKISYSYDTLWTHKVKVGKEPSWSAHKFSDKVYLVLNASQGSTRLVAIDDKLGKPVLDKFLDEKNVYRKSSSQLFDEVDNKIVICGEQISRIKSKTHRGFFLMELKPDGSITRNRFFDYNRILVDNEAEGPKKATFLIKEIVKDGSEYLMMGENVYRSDFQGEEIISTVVSAALISTFTPAFGTISISGPIKYVSHNFGVLRPSNDLLLLKTISKGRVEKVFSNSDVFFTNMNEIFDSKFYRDTDSGKQLLYFDFLDNERLILGTTDLLNPDTIKKYIFSSKNGKGTNYKIYPLTKDSLLLETVNSNSSGYLVIYYGDFK